MSQPGDETVNTIKHAADIVIQHGSLPASATPHGIELLSGVTIPWETLMSLLHGRTEIAEVVYYLTDAAIRTGLSIPVWSDRQWDDHLTVLGFPDHNLAHPGTLWVRESVRGNALSLGFGGRNLDARFPERVLPLIPQVLDLVGIVLPTSVWGLVRAQHEHMGATAGMLTRMQRGTSNRQLRPAAGTDIITLLGSQRYREELLWLAGGTMKMAGIAAPTRQQGWLLNANDTPEFTEAIALSADLELQGISRGLLVTASEVAESRTKRDFIH